MKFLGVKWLECASKGQDLHAPPPTPQKEAPCVAGFLQAAEVTKSTLEKTDPLLCLRKAGGSGEARKKRPCSRSSCNSCGFCHAVRQSPGCWRHLQ